MTFRITEFTGVHHMVETISPEAFKAQRQAELEQMARYRAKRLEQYKAWADPVQREQIKANMSFEAQAAKESVEGKTVWLSPLKKLEDHVTITPVVKTPVKRGFFARLWARVRGQT